MGSKASAAPGKDLPTLGTMPSEGTWAKAGFAPAKLAATGAVWAVLQITLM